jgi:hypothetical protein
MSRRSNRSNAKEKQSERARAPRRPLLPPPEVVLARRPRGATVRANEAGAATPLPVPALALDSKPIAAKKRAARIVSQDLALDDAERERRHLLARLLDSEGPNAVTRAARAYRRGGFGFPEEQPVQLKLLEHSDESEVCQALIVLSALLDQQTPIKLPVFEQRLKRLEDSAEDPETRRRAAELRRVLRT